jgi:hypothetical protein
LWLQSAANTPKYFESGLIVATKHRREKSVSELEKKLIKIYKNEIRRFTVLDKNPKSLICFFNYI